MQKSMIPGHHFCSYQGLSRDFGYQALSLFAEKVEKGLGTRLLTLVKTGEGVYLRDHDISVR